MIEEKNSNVKKWIIAGVILAVVAIAMFIKLHKDKELIYGKWSCGSNIMLELSKDKKFSLYDVTDKDKFNIVGTYKIDKQSTENTNHKFDVTMKTNDRTIDGEKFDSEYSTKYEITIDGEDKNNLVMINAVSYNIYICQREE